MGRELYKIWGVPLLYPTGRLAAKFTDVQACRFSRGPARGGAATPGPRAKRWWFCPLLSGGGVVGSQNPTGH